MRILTNYLLKDALKPGLTALFIMLSLVWLMQSLRFMDFIINKGLSVSTFLYVTALIIPSLLMVILPLAFFAGGIFSFKRLSDDNELPSLFASGFSRWRIIRPALLVALGVSLMCYILAFWLQPAGMRTFKDMQHELRQSGDNLLLEEGTFNELGNGLMVYVKDRVGRTELHSLLVHDNRNTSKPVTWMAELGQVVFTDDGYPRLILVNGTRQEVTENRLSILEFKRHTIDITRQFTRETARWRGAEERYMGELLLTDDVPERDQKRFAAEFQKRLMWPLTPFPFILIAAVFLIKPVRRREGAFKATAYACATGASYQAAQMVLHNMASKGNIWVLYGQWLLPLLVCLICAIILTEKGDKKGYSYA